MRLIAYICATLLTLAPAGAETIQLPLGSLPLKLGRVVKPIDMSNKDLVIKGEVTGTKPARFAIRMDDTNSYDYGTRVNLQRTLPIGTFTWRLPMQRLKTHNKEPFDLNGLRKLILFDADKSGHITLTHVSLEPRPTLASGAIGYSFGNEDSLVFAGFTRITPGDPRLQGKRKKAITRPGVDPLIASGIEALEKLTLARPSNIPAGTKIRLTLWTEMTSAWERLPAVTRRRIRVNKHTIVDETRSPQQWITERYMQGRNREATQNTDIWEAYGKHRGGKVTHDMIMPEEGLTLEWAGSGAASLYLSALLIEPEGVDALTDIEARRADWFRTKWRVDTTIGERIAADKNLSIPQQAMPTPFTLSISKDTGASLYIDITSNEDIQAPKLSLTWENETLQDKLRPQIWAGQKRLEKLRTGGNLFTPRTETLRADTNLFPLYKGVSRRYALWFPETDLPIGTYSATLSFTSGGHKSSLPLRILSTGATLPAPNTPVGFYMLSAPHLSWHKDLHEDRDKQNKCDLNYLASLGILANAPAFPVPYGKGRNDFVAISKLALQNATSTPWLAYHAAFNMVQQLGMDGGANTMADTLKTLKELGLPAPVWSMADEPSNASSAYSRMLKPWVKKARAAAPDALLAGHLNNPKDKSVLSLFDVAIINHGFGIDKKDIDYVRENGISPWIYNTGRPRITAGLWSWITQPDRYLQWHARLPLGDPFDPTDAREGDVSMFPPMASVCAPQPDININVLEMASGIADQRWLLWLDQQKNSKAQEMARILRSNLGTKWKKVADMPRKTQKSLQNAIAELALYLYRVGE